MKLSIEKSSNKTQKKSLTNTFTINQVAIKKI